MSDIVERQQKALELQYEAAKHLAQQAEWADTFTSTPFWNDFFRPMLEEDIRGFQEVQAWRLEGEEFERARGQAIRSRTILEVVLSRQGSREKHLKEMKEIAAKLENARKEGKIT